MVIQSTVVNIRRGGNLPLMNLHERLLSVLGCKFMDDVLIDAPPRSNTGYDCITPYHRGGTWNRK